MSTQTTNLNLVKPGDNDALDIADINDNMDTLDAAVGAVDVSTDGSLQEQINELGESVSKMKTYVDTNSSYVTLDAYAPSDLTEPIWRFTYVIATNKLNINVRSSVSDSWHTATLSMS